MQHIFIAIKTFYHMIDIYSIFTLFSENIINWSRTYKYLNKNDEILITYIFLNIALTIFICLLGASGFHSELIDCSLLSPIGHRM